MFGAANDSFGAPAVPSQSLSVARALLFICDDRYASISLDDSTAGFAFLVCCFFLRVGVSACNVDCSAVSVPVASKSSSTENTNDGWGLIQWNFSLNSSLNFLCDSAFMSPPYSKCSMFVEGTADKPEFRSNAAATGAMSGDEVET